MTQTALGSQADLRLASPSFIERANAGGVIRVQATNFAKAAKFAPVPELRELGSWRLRSQKTRIWLADPGQRPALGLLSNNSRQDSSSAVQRSGSPVPVSGMQSEPWPSSQRSSVVTGSKTLAQEPMVTGIASR